MGSSINDTGRPPMGGEFDKNGDRKVNVQESEKKYPVPGSKEVEELNRLWEEFLATKGTSTRELNIEQSRYNARRDAETGRSDRGQTYYPNPDDRWSKFSAEFMQLPAVIEEYKKHGWSLD